VWNPVRIQGRSFRPLLPRLKGPNVSHAVGTDIDPFLAGLEALVVQAEPMCAVGRWIASLPPEHAEALNRMLDNPDVKTIDLFNFMHGHGLTSHRTALGTHRNRACSCVR